MLVEQVLTSLPLIGGKPQPFTTNVHPIGPLTADEISESSRLIKASWPPNTDVQFKVITLKEPAKAELGPFLVKERACIETEGIDRRSLVVYYLRNTVCALMVTVTG